jgi:hypothetical protein
MASITLITSITRITKNLCAPMPKNLPRTLQHIVEPTALLLTWQPVKTDHPDRTHRTVARLDRIDCKGNTVTFRYLQDTEDFDAAVAAGFKGHPAFRLPSQTASVGSTGQRQVKDADNQVFGTSVLETFLRRLPPRKREDFPAFLAMHRLPAPFEHSDFALLGYTGAKLPSDGFAIVPVFDAGQVPCELILEVAGFRHELNTDVSSVCIGGEVWLVAELVTEDNNPHDDTNDTNAVAIFHIDTCNPEHSFQRIGYVNRAMTSIVRTWMKDRKVSAKIERVNGKPQCPLVYIRLSVR